MPYVEVWVEDHECDGQCDTAMQATHALETALTAARDGDIKTVIQILGCATDDKDAKREEAKERELHRLYDEWLAFTLPRPEFLSFAHSRRKATAA